MTKINCFLKDVSGASRVTKKREEAFRNASGDNNYKDPINMVSRMLHPAPFLVTVSKIKDVSKTAKKYTLVPIDGFLPVFQAGNYVSIKFQIGNTITTRPYSICSAPYQAKLDNPYFEITVRNTLDGFISNYMYSSVKEGDTLTVEMPFGHFYYEPLRDSNNIVGIAGGSGITPFYSMAQEILNGTLDINLTILYGSISHKDIILYDELNEITKKTNKVKVIHVISGIDEELYDNDEKGYISKDIIKKYSIDNAPENGKTTYFICGPANMYSYIKGELEALNVPIRRIRMEELGNPKDIRKEEGYPKEKASNIYKLTVVRGIKEDIIDARADEAIAVALERAGILIKTCCRSGECGACRCKVIDGEYFILKGDSRRATDKRFNYIYTCHTYPLSDMKIKITII